MRALRYQTFADPVDLRVEDVPEPVPAAGEVLVRIHAASVNPIDWKIATGGFRLLVRGGLPRTMGSDFAGEVIATGTPQEVFQNPRVLAAYFEEPAHG